MVKLFSKNSNLCDHNSPTLQTDGRTDRQTDRQTTCDRNTALCTKVHRAVKTLKNVKTFFTSMLNTGKNDANAEINHLRLTVSGWFRGVCEFDVLP